MFHTRLLRLILTLLIMAAPTAAFAWGAEGHRVTGLVAADLLTPKARLRMNQLMPGADLADIALYMDINRRELSEQIPGSDKWHYDNQPVCKIKPYAEYCAGGNCASAQIPVYFAVLGNTAATQEARVQALRFLVHMVGDIHQPLHAADDDDLGANLKFVLVPGNDMQRRLHSVWDSDLVKLAIRGQSEADYARSLLTRYREKEIPQWQQANGIAVGTAIAVSAWMNESYELSKNITYAKLPNFACGKDWPSSLTAPVMLPQTYMDAAGEVIGPQLAKAGARIASLINLALDAPSVPATISNPLSIPVPVPVLVPVPLPVPVPNAGAGLSLAPDK